MNRLLSLWITFSFLWIMINGVGDGNLVDEELAEAARNIVEAEHYLVDLNITEIFITGGKVGLDQKLVRYNKSMEAAMNNIHVLKNKAKVAVEPEKTILIKKMRKIIDQYSSLERRVAKDINKGKRFLILEANKIIIIGNLHSRRAMVCIRSLYSRLDNRTAVEGLKEADQCEDSLVKLEGLNVIKMEIANKIGDHDAAGLLRSINITARFVSKAHQKIDAIFVSYKSDIFAEFEDFKLKAEQVKTDFNNHTTRMLEEFQTNGFKKALRFNEFAKNAYIRSKKMLKKVQKVSKGTMYEVNRTSINNWIITYLSDMEKTKKLRLRKWWEMKGWVNPTNNSRIDPIGWIAILPIIFIFF